MNISDYCSKLGWYLVTIPAGSKGPTRFGWQQPERALSDPQAAKEYYEKNETHNVGILHSASGTCAIDIDNVEHTKIIFDELGINFSDLMNSAPQIVGRENRGKLLFKAPPDLVTHKISWPTKDDPRKTEVVFELRAGAVQDVLPPSIHPDTGRPYEWAGKSIWDGLPELPHQLLTLWREWDRFRPQLQNMCPWKAAPEFQPPRKPRPKGDGTSVIDTFNEAYDMHTLLEQYGYKRTGRNRYLSPNSTSGLAGVKLFDDGRAYSHHASDPFDSAHSFDAFELWMQYEHQGNMTKAVKEAATLLNVTQDEEYEYDREAIEHGAQVAAQILKTPVAKKETGPLDNIPESLLSVPGILQDVVNYYTVTAIKPQPQFAVQAAIAFGSVVMGRRWVTDQRNFSSLFFLNIGETGSGKEHTKTVLENLLEEADLEELIGPAGYTSGSGVVSTLTKKPTHVSVIDELGRQLQAAAAKGMQHKADGITAIMEVFGRQDGTLRQQGYATNTMKSAEAEKLEKVIKRPSLTLVGMSTPFEFLKAISGGDVASGLLNRFIIVKSEIGVQMSQKKRQSSISDRLAKWAKDHATAHEGTLDAGNIHDMPPHPIEVPFTPEAETILRDYEERLVDAIKKESGTGLEAMYNRSREIAMRLSLIIARSMGHDEIGPDAVTWAIEYVDHYANQTIEMFRLNMAEGPFQACCKEVFAKIEKAGLEGITERDISRSVSKFANLEPKRRKDVMDALTEDRGIECRQTNVGQRGKPRIAYFAPPTH